MDWSWKETKRVWTVLALILLLFTGMYLYQPSPAPLRGELATSTLIKHIVVLMKENHAFDNYFGTFPGAEGIPPKVLLPDGSGGTVAPHWINSTSTDDLPHHRAAMLEAWDNGSNDRFAVVAAQWGPGRAFEAMGYYDERQIPFYWGLARNFTLADHYFQPMFGPTLPNRLFSFAGTNAGLETNVVEFSKFDGLTIFDQLQAKGVSWRYYHEPSSLHAPLPLYFRTLASNPEAVRRMIPLSRLLPDVRVGDFAQVTFVDPSDSSTISEHPAQNVSLGESWTKMLVSAIMSSGRWSTTAIFLTWDESGGYYDHLSPPQVDEWGYGFRVPLLVISPFARRGWIDRDVMDHTSILKFIADNWGLPYLTNRQALAGNLMMAFLFGRPVTTLLTSPMSWATYQRGPAALPYSRATIPRELRDWGALADSRPAKSKVNIGASTNPGPSSLRLAPLAFLGPPTHR